MEGTVTRADMVSLMVEELQISRSQAAEMVELLLSEMAQSLAHHNELKISSFGTFLIRQKRERLGRNPRTGESATITPRRVVSFRASPLFRKKMGSERAVNSI